MKTQSTTAKNINIMFAIVTGVFLMTSYQAPVSAEPWELRTATEEVRGTRDIEAGRLDEGIRVSNLYFTTTPKNQKGAILTNLCLAHTLKRNYEIAMGFCDRAVAHRRGGRAAYNNRGVLHAILGNYRMATSDLEKAGCMKVCVDNLPVKGDRDRPMAVAKRNLKRAQFQLALQEKQEKEFHAAK